VNVLVTGGASGLGAAIVEAVAADGGKPYVLDRVPVAGIPHVLVDLADTRAAELAGEYGVTLLVPGGMATKFFDGRAEKYKPGPDVETSYP
jgi:NAD(P)-dependent dehydrogenase (short-subunit alcohol dehydrogenase family)